VVHSGDEEEVDGPQSYITQKPASVFLNDWAVLVR